MRSSGHAVNWLPYISWRRQVYNCWFFKASPCAGYVSQLHLDVDAGA